MAVENIDIVLRVLEKNTKALKDVNRQLKDIGKSAKTAGKTASSAGDSFKNMGKQLIGLTAGVIVVQKLGSALLSAVGSAAELEATLQSLEAVTVATGRNINDVYAAMETQVGSLASRANVASGFLKGLTTELNVEQINQMTTSIKNASIAMGEDFNTQLPLIIKAVKQLNPAILDNIGVTVRLDRINRQITQGYFGMNKEINEATQQNAIFQEIIKQTAKFQGQEAAFLETTKGKWVQLTVAVEDFGAVLGGLFVGSGAATLLGFLGDTVRAVTSLFPEVKRVTTQTERWKKELVRLKTSLDEGAISIEEFRKAIDLIGPKSLIPELTALHEEFADTILIVSDQLGLAVPELDRYAESFKQAGATIGQAAPTMVDELMALKKAQLELAEAQEKLRQENIRLTSAIDQPSILGIEEEDLEQDFALADEFFKKLIARFRETEAIRDALSSELRDIRLANMSIFNEEVFLIEEQFLERLRLLESLKLEDQALNNELRLEIENDFFDQLASLQEQRVNELAQQWLQKWAFVQRQTTKIFTALFKTITTNAKNLKEVMRSTFEAIGQAIVQNLVEKGVNAIFQFIAGTVAANAAMAVEGVAVRALTSRYNSLAAAKTAANPFSGPGRIAAAAAVKGSLDALLLGGIAGFTGGGTFGQSGGVGFTGGGTLAPAQTGMTINFNGPVTDTQFIRESLVPAIETAVLDGASRLMMDDQNLTGGSSIAFA